MTTVPLRLPRVTNGIDADELVRRLTETDVQAVYRRLGVEQFKSGGPGNWLVFVPWRDNTKTPALSINRTTGLWVDHASDEGGSIYQAVMRAEGCDFPEAVKFVADIAGKPTPAPVTHLHAPRGTIVATYDYHYEDGTFAYQVVRYQPKRFSQRTKNDQGAWVNSLEGVRRVLYRLPELLKSTGRVYIVEGEKDVDRLWSLGLIATTNAQGAGKWQADFADSLAGRDVVILPDNDDSGRKHMQAIAASLVETANSVRILELPDLPLKGDVSDWLDAGHTEFELEVLADTVPSAKPEDHALGPVVVSLEDVEAKPIDWVWKRWLARGKVTILGGQGGHGKSTLTAWLASLLSRGGNWPDGMPAPQGRVLFLLAEDALDDTLRPRLDAHDADLSQVKALTFIREALEKGPGTRETFFNLSKHLPMLEQAILEHDIDVVIIDPLTSFMQNAKRNDEGEVRDILTPLTSLANRLHVAIIGIMHIGKPNGTSRSPVQQLLGSSAFGNVARMVWMIAPTSKEPNASRILGVAKTNLAMMPKPIEFEIAEESGSLRWLGESENSLDDVMSASAKHSPEREQILEYLAGLPEFTGATPDQIANALGKRAGTIRFLLADMAKAGTVTRIATGLYSHPYKHTNNTNNTNSTNSTNNTNGGLR